MRFQGKIKDVYKILDNCFSEIGNNPHLFARVKNGALPPFSCTIIMGSELVKEAVVKLKILQEIKTTEEIVAEIKSIQFSDILEIGRWLTPERRWTLFRKV